MTIKTTNTEVNFADGFLLISSTDAIDPIIWRMEIGNSQETVISIKKNKEIYDLKIKLSGSKEKTIASFETKEQTINAMMLINQALENKQNSTNNSCKQTNETPANKKTCKSDIVMAVIGTFLIFILIWLIQLPSDKTSKTNYKNESSTNSIGKTLSADDFLNAR